MFANMVGGEVCEINAMTLQLYRRFAYCNCAHCIYL
jgi:hypothetical protein